MPAASLKDLYFDELADLYDAETQMIRTLPRLAEAARAPELRETLTRHCEESRLHLERLDLIFTHWGQRRRSRPCAGIAGIVQEADERLNEQTTDDVRDAAIIGAAQRIEHYEIAAYGCARTYARRLNRADEARLLQETLDEEGRADRRLTEMAEAHINDDARTEQDLRDAGQPGRLRYAALDQMPRGRDGMEPIQVLNDAGEDLGSLDGLLVEGDRRAPRYIVVQSAGLLARHRYLLPLDRVRFDAAQRVLRIDVAKGVADRYPEFDHDEFHAMNDRERQGFEARLLEFFQRDRPAASASDTAPGFPEWLMTGAWVTVPPERAQRLPEEARGFANEFSPRSGETDTESPQQREREQLVAREAPGTLAEPRTVTPPHGDKLQ